MYVVIAYNSDLQTVVIGDHKAKPFSTEEQAERKVSALEKKYPGHRFLALPIQREG